MSGVLVPLSLLVLMGACVNLLGRSPTTTGATGQPTITQASTRTTKAPTKPEPPKKSAQQIEAEKREAKLGRQPVASAWDGHYYAVEQHLKGTMRDPDSLAFDGCTQVYHTEKGWLVGCNWRGRNGFGGMNRQANWFTIRNERVVAMHDYSAYKE